MFYENKFTNLPFPMEELNETWKKAWLQTLEKLVRLACWEKLLTYTNEVDPQSQKENVALVQALEVPLLWRVNGDSSDLLARLVFEDVQAEALDHCLDLLAEKGFDLDKLKSFREELNNSIDNEALTLCYRQEWNRKLQNEIGTQYFWQGLKGLEEFLHNPSLFLEQWGAVGHPVHTNNKTKLGVSLEEVFLTAPEFKGQARLVMEAIKRNCLVLEGGEPDAYMAMIYRYFPEQLKEWKDALGKDAQYYLPIPVHPIHVKSAWKGNLQPGLKLISSAPCINSYASLSFRTVYPEGGVNKPFIKLPVGLRLSSVHRNISPRACQMGPRVSTLLQNICHQDDTISVSFSPLIEMWGMHLDAADDIAKYYSVIFRSPLVEVISEDELAIPVSSLMATTPMDKHLCSHVLTSDTFNIDVLMENFEKYIHHLLSSVLSLYLKYGIALEAHQQNSFLKISHDDQVLGFIIRDFGGVRIHMKSLEEKGFSLKLHKDPLYLAESRRQCRQKLTHCLYVCHIGAIISALSADFQVPSSSLWRVVAQETKRVFGICKFTMSADDYAEDRKAFLHESWETKAFLTMRLQNMSRDRWTQISNPIKQ